VLWLFLLVPNYCKGLKEPPLSPHMCAIKGPGCGVLTPQPTPTRRVVIDSSALALPHHIVPACRCHTHPGVRPLTDHDIYSSHHWFG